MYKISLYYQAKSKPSDGLRVRTSMPCACSTWPRYTSRQSVTVLDWLLATVVFVTMSRDVCNTRGRYDFLHSFWHLLWKNHNLYTLYGTHLCVKNPTLSGILLESTTLSLSLRLSGTEMCRKGTLVILAYAYRSQWWYLCGLVRARPRLREGEWVLTSRWTSFSTCFLQVSARWPNL